MDNLGTPLPKRCVFFLLSCFLGCWLAVEGFPFFLRAGSFFLHTIPHPIKCDVYYGMTKGWRKGREGANV